MSFEIPQVFISSTSEFATERRELAERLRTLGEFRCEPYIYEEESLPGTSPERQCEAKLRASEIVVLIIGEQYGSEFPGKRMSIVEWEYERARELENATLQPYIKRVPDPSALDPRQTQFIKRVTDFRGGTWSRFFGVAEELVSGVLADVKRWRLDSWRRLGTRAHERRRWQDRLAIRGAIAVAILTSAGVAGGALMRLPVAALALILVTGVLTFAALGWLLKAEVA